jgi:hypothetical protein
MRHQFLAVLAILAVTACAEQGGPVAPADVAHSLEDAPSASLGSPAGHRYKVTIENLTTGQPLSPGVVVTHTNRVSLFAAGTVASNGIREIAENGDPSVAFAELSGVAGVRGLLTTEVPVGRVGGQPFASSLSFEIDAPANARRLSLALMLICTNDGFAGLDAVRLPRGDKAAVFYARAYDAGTEVNDERASSIVPPCFGIGPVGGLTGGVGRTAEIGTVAMHPGIRGMADLTAAHAWNGAVARVTVRRLH